VVARLGQTPTKLKPARYQATKTIRIPTQAELRRPPLNKELVGVDVFLHNRGSTSEVAERIQTVSGERLELKMISTRGVLVWPRGLPETATGDHWRCRFTAREGITGVAYSDVIEVLQRATAAGLDVIKTENLYNFEGRPGFSMEQGE
jgi:isocitrate dehydrogenase